MRQRRAKQVEKADTTDTDGSEDLVNNVHNDNAANGTSITSITSSNSESFKFFTGLLTSAQRIRSHESLLRKLKEFYYRYTDSTIACHHQKFCASTLWRIMVIPFGSDKNKCLENLLKFVNQAIAVLGTEDDVEQYGFPLTNLKPFFYYIIKFVNQCHIDTRWLVRMRVLEVAEQILVNFNSHPLLNGASCIREKTKEMLNERVKDKSGPVRIIATRCLRFFVEDIDTRKNLMSMAKFDENADLRKAAIVALQSKIDKVKIEVFINQAYDVSEEVSAAAFLALSQVCLKRIRVVSERQCLVMWGLSHPTRKKVRDIVTNHLLPNWLKDSENSIEKLLERINPANKLEVARAVINALFDKLESGEIEMDSHFLMTCKTSTLSTGKVTTTKVQAWFLLCEKYKDCSDQFEKLRPTGDELCETFKKVINQVHEEKGTDDDNIDEFSEGEIALIYTLGLVRFTEMEEGTRRNIIDVCEEILHDATISASTVIVEVVNLLFKMHESFETFVDDTLAKIFEPYYKNPTTPCAISANPLPDGCTTSAVPAVTSTPKHPQSSRRATFNRTIRSASTSFIDSNIFDVSCTDASFLPIEQQAEVASKKLQRHKLITKLEQLRKVGDTSGIRNTEVELEEIAGELKNLLNKARCNELIQIHEQADGDAMHIGSENYQPPLSIGVDENEANFVLSDSGILKGLVVLTRCISLLQKHSRFLEPPHDDYLLHYLQNDSMLIRKYVLHAVYFIGIFDPEQARNSMQVMITALRNDPERSVQHVAFKCIVDLLIHYELRTFYQHEETDEFCELEAPLNNPNVSDKEIEKFFLTLLGAFKEETTLFDTTLRTTALIKLFLANRITDITAMAGVICIIVDPKFGSTMNSYIGYFVPLYMKSNFSNARRAINAIYESLQSLLQVYDKRSGDQLFAENLHNLLKSVAICINSTSIPADKNVLQERFVHKILKLITKNSCWIRKFNLELIKSVKDIEIEDLKCAANIVSYIEKVMMKFESVPNSVEITKVKSALRAFLKELESKFPSRMENEESQVAELQSEPINESEVQETMEQNQDASIMLGETMQGQTENA